MSVCKKCRDEKFILTGCCNGRECGCMGMPVGIENCDRCNRENKGELPKSITEEKHFKYLDDYTKDLTKHAEKN